MTKPTLDQLKEANPVFFSPEWGDAGEISNFLIEEENDQMMFKVAAPHDTWPVYAIDEEHKLSFVRHGWHLASLH